MRISCAVEIAGAPDEVFPWIDDPEKAMKWQAGVKQAEIITDTPERIGTTFREEMEEGGNRLEMRGVISGYVKNKMIAFQLDSRIHRLEVEYSITGAAGRSVVTVESDIHWKFPMNIMSLVMGRKIKAGILKQTEAEFAELKRLCEEEKAQQR